ncbi:hypothetical protein PVAND_002084 [Polypedilum vanderplanki]|uniref:Uncharacterized protein n=1 Tax=Polypedilum vanderplanki TaxID=319348 RepID=A0A9J6BR53_POLVA|nr:hypothetical protein PVAND_002084 [Polypedilum vanderplanki]
MDPKQQYCASNEILVPGSATTSTASKSKAQLNSGNYINVVPMAVVNSGVQYHSSSRRKYPPPQMTPDYQSRVYFGDYVRDRCREDINNSYYSIPQSQQTQQSSSHHHHHQQSVATSTSDVEQLNANNTNTNNSNNSNNNNSLVISPQTSLQINQSSSSTSSNASSSNQQQSQQQTITPSVLYTVQRVVSTSQLPPPANYGSNSNASSLSSIITRNETDCGLPNNNAPKKGVISEKKNIFVTLKPNIKFTE